MAPPPPAAAAHLDIEVLHGPLAEEAVQQHLARCHDHLAEAKHDACLLDELTPIHAQVGLCVLVDPILA
jgi:hypothetical protein